MPQLHASHVCGLPAGIMGSFATRSRLMSILGAFALMAMIVRGVVPAGYMVAPSAEAGHLVDIVICHGDGSEYTRAVLNLKTGKTVDPSKQSDKSDAGKHSTCPFATTAHFPLPEVGQKPGRPDLGVVSHRAFFVAIIPGRGLAAPPPPARGPPLTI